MLLLPDHFVPGFSAEIAEGEAVRWFIYAGTRLLVQLENDNAAQMPLAGDWPLAGEIEELRRLYMGSCAGVHCYASEIDAGVNACAGLTALGLRELWGVLDEASIGLAGQALQLIDWDRCHCFCGRCGEPMTLSISDRSKRCPACQLNHYPRIAPAVMVRITRGDEILMARSPRFPAGMYSVLAGFVDPGETLEQTIHREVMEEVGLRIDNIRYFTSQSWPFPHSLMIAFTADYAGGEIRLEDEEIEHADWFTRDDMPKIPSTISIARRMVDDYLNNPPVV
jgi:NAD+ diphosphatase